MAMPTGTDLVWVVVLAIGGFIAAVFLGSSTTTALVVAALVFVTRLAYASYARGTFRRYKR